ncbi:A-kinase anchor protein 13 isoform X3 [Lepisosteus oculatus]|uniref:A-kinase anchor protein 13 isoform X3 n=1 Tax=Lepisosteus oculatus TaxID=7918 RepID=UPI00372083F2
MKLNPQQAPLYGECLLTVQLCDEDRFDDEEDVEFYLLFAGTSQRHLTSTRRVDHVTLHAVCPAHGCCEAVLVTLCSARPGRPVGSVAQERFLFVQDLAFDVAQFLVSSAGRPAALEDARLLDEFPIPPAESERLDGSVALAMRHMALPEGWSVLGAGEGSEPSPQETLLHFAARRGLWRLALFLLQQPGGRAALRLPNRQGATPVDVARQRGNCRVEELLARDAAALQDCWTGGSQLVFSGDCQVKHHPGLGTYTLTAGAAPGSQPASLDGDVERLRGLMRSHRAGKDALSSHSSSVLLNTDQEHSGMLTGSAEQAEDPDNRSEQPSVEELWRVSLGTCVQEWAPHCAVEGDKGVDSSHTSKALPSECEADTEQNLDASLQNNADDEVRVCPCETSSQDYQCRKEKEVGTASASVVDSRKESDKSNTVPSQTESKSPTSNEEACGNQEETDTALPVISAGQDSPYKADKENQEGEQAEEGLSEKVSQALIEDKSQPDNSESSLGDNMGQTRSQDHYETAEREVEKCSVKEEKSEPVQDLERSSGGEDLGAAIVKEWESKTEDSEDCSVTQELFDSAIPGENTQEAGCGFSAEPEIGIASSCTAANGPDCGEGACKSEACESEQIQETAAVDYFKENECSGSEENNNETAEPERGAGDCSTSCLKSSMEKGNLDEQSSGSVEAVCSLGFDLPEKDNEEDCPGNTEGISSSMVLNSTSSEVSADAVKQDPFTLQLLAPEAHAAGEEQGNCSIASPADEPEELRSATLETVVELEEHEPLSSENAATSSSALGVDSAAGAVEDESSLNQGAQPAAGDVGAAVALSSEEEEDSFLSVSSSTAESFYLPEEGKAMELSAEALPPQEIGNMENGDMDILKTSEGNLLHPDSLSPSEITTSHLVDIGGEPPGLVEKEPEHDPSSCEYGSSEPDFVASCDLSDCGEPQTMAESQCEQAKENKESEFASEKQQDVEKQMSSSANGQCGEEPLDGAVLLESHVSEFPGEKEDVFLNEEDERMSPTVSVQENICTEISKPELNADLEGFLAFLGAEERVSEENELRSLPTVLEEDTEEVTVEALNCDVEEEQEQEQVDENNFSADGSDLTSADSGIAHGDSSESAEIHTLTSEKDSVLESPITPSCSENSDSTSSLLAGQDTAASVDTVSSLALDLDSLESESKAAGEDARGRAEGDLSDIAQTAGGTGEAAGPGVEDSPTVLENEREVREAVEDEVDFPRASPFSAGEETTGDKTMIHRDEDKLCSGPCTDPGLLDRKQSPQSTESPQSPEDRAVSPARQESGSDADGFSGPDHCDDNVDNVFGKGDEALTGDSTSEASVSCSSTDGPPTSTPERGPEARSWGTEEGQRATGGCEAEEEEKDRLTEVPVRSALLRSSIRSLSPFRRHSWGPGKNLGPEAEMSQRSSLRSLGDVVKKPPIHRRSYSLEGLSADRQPGRESPPQGISPRDARRTPLPENEERGSLVSLTEEEQESDLGENSSLDSQKSESLRPLGHSYTLPQPLTKSVSLLTISQTGLDTLGRSRPKRRISFSFNISPLLPKSKTVFSIGSSSSDEEESDNIKSSTSMSSSLGYSAGDEHLSASASLKDADGKPGTTKVSRTFSYIKSKMYSSKKTREKDKEKAKEKEKEAKEKDKKTLNGHLFSPVTGFSAQCYHCNKAPNTKEVYHCATCNAYVHKGCRENLPSCTKVKVKHQKQQFAVPDSASMPAVTMRHKSSLPRERPRSAVFIPDDHSLLAPRRHTSLMPFHSSNLSKSISISNIAGSAYDEIPLKGMKFLSQSTDSLHKPSKVNESTESLADEGTEMMDSQLMGEFEPDTKDLEADSWSMIVDKKLVKQLKKDMIKRQDVIYELIQTEMHHVRTLKIMADVYSKGLCKELQQETNTERIFPVLDDLVDIHTQFFSRVLERKRESQQESRTEGKDGGFVIRKIGDILVNQFTGSSAERMKKIYGKFCSRHNEAVNYYKECCAKDKRFQAFVTKKMSLPIVRRLGIPECILLVTQRITKYPVLLQRILQHTKENEEDHADLSRALTLVKEVIAAVDSKVNEHEKKKRLKEIYSRTDSKSIMRMKSGQMFAREDLLRRKLIHDGPLQLKNNAGRLKDVQALLFAGVFVFLQEKDQKYVFASLDQRATVISLQKLIVREVANEEKGLFLITAGSEKPEMVEVHASSKEERNAWMQLIQDAMHSMEKDDDEGIPSETEEDKRILETKAREMRELLRQKDGQIATLLEEKVRLFRDMCEGGRPEEGAPGAVTRTLFRASSDDVPKGESIMKDALKEVETLQTLVSGSLGGAVGQQVSSNLEAEGSVGPVLLPRRAETFGGFDSHQMNASKNGEKDEGEESPDLRRTESDSVLKKGGNANLLLLLKRNSEQVLHSVTHLHELLSVLQAVVVQQDTFIEDQRQALSERPASRPSSRPNSLIEQEKQRSLEKQRQELANLQRQQAAHAEERRRREREWGARERELAQREAHLQRLDEEAQRGRRELEQDREELRGRKDEYQRDLERLRAAQRQLDRDREQVRRDLERIEQLKQTEDKRKHRTPSSTSDESLKFHSTSSLDRDPVECELSSSPRTDSLTRTDSKQKGKNLNPFAFNQSLKAQGSEGQNQIPGRLLQLARSKDKKDKKDKKKKKGKGQLSPAADLPHTPVSEAPAEGEIFC